MYVPGASYHRVENLFCGAYFFPAVLQVRTSNGGVAERSWYHRVHEPVCNMTGSSVSAAMVKADAIKRTWVMYDSLIQVVDCEDMKIGGS
jgi:hypothetical protein